MKKLLNIEYICIQGTYWMYYGIICNFASVFLLARGYSNSEIGITLAVANVLAVVLQPIIADLADRTKKISLIGITQVITVVMMIVTAGLLVVRGKTMALTVIFVLLIAWHMVLQPLFNSLAFRLAESGIQINFGVARSMGSLIYAGFTAVFGVVVERCGILSLPLTGELILVMLLISLILAKRSFDKAKGFNGGHAAATLKISEEKPTDGGEAPINLSRFIKRNRYFFVVNVGVLGVYFSNAIFNHYMAQIITSVGGNSGDMGVIFSISAICEIPFMAGIYSLRKRFSCQLMLKVASVGFFLKIAACCFATSISMIVAAHLFQIIGFGLFLPTMVLFIDEMMSKGEAVKGQALFTTMVTVTTVFSSLVGGIILDLSSVKVLLMIGAVVTAAGAVIIIAAVDKVKKK